VAAKAALPLPEVVEHYTNVYRRFGFGIWSDAPRAPEWYHYTAHLQTLATHDQTPFSQGCLRCGSGDNIGGSCKHKTIYSPLFAVQTYNFLHEVDNAQHEALGTMTQFCTHPPRG
jgi:hypothetical protein